tara:strand:- start:1217 stop:1438 length:222 start_codon:yes stop_codon:yes gene_type:complete
MTTKEHMKYHEGLWNMLGCKMKVIEEDKRKDTITYIDLNSKKDVKGICTKYTYTSNKNHPYLFKPITVGVYNA